MRSFFANLVSLTLPFNAGPNTSRIVIGPTLPPPLDTYVTVNGPYQAGIIFYGTGDDTTYTYMCVIDNAGFGAYNEVHIGQVLGGFVQEESPGVPSAISLFGAPSGVPTVRDMRGAAVAMYASVGAAIVSGATSASVGSGGNQVSVDPSGVLVQAGSQVSVDPSGVVVLAGTSQVGVSPSGVVVLAGGSGDDITLIADDDININTVSGDIALVSADDIDLTAGGSGDITLTAPDLVVLIGTTAVVLRGPLLWQSANGATATTVSAVDDTARTTTSTSYTSVLSPAGICGTAFVAPASGKVLVHIGVDSDNNGAGFSASTFQIRTGTVVGSGTIFTAAADNRSVFETGTDGQNWGKTFLVTGLTAGADYNAEFLHRVNTGTGTYARRNLIVQPAI